MKTNLTSYANLLSKYLGAQRLLAGTLGILVIGNIAFQLASPQVVRYFIDAAQAGAAVSLLLRAASLFLIFAVCQQATGILSAYASENLAWKTTNALRADLAEHCLGLDLSFHNTHTPGEMIERLDGDVSALSNFFSQFIIQIGGNALLLLGILALLFRENVWVGLGLTGFSVLTLFIMLRFRNIAVPHWTAERRASADLFGFLEERLAGTEDIRSNGAESYVMRQFYSFMRTLYRRSMKATLMFNILFNTMFLLFTLGTATAFAIGAYLFLGHAITIGSVYVIFFYTTMLERPIHTIVRQVEDLQKAGAGITRIQELFSIKNKIQNKAVGGKTLPVDGRALAIAFQNVTFGYDDQLTKNGKPPKNGKEGGAVQEEAQTALNGEPVQKEYVLKDISFHLKAGQVLGLLGRTGSGKTTLTRLLFRLYDPDRGTVSILPDQDPGCSLDIRQIQLSALRSQVGMVTQNIQLFNATVRDNLTFFDRSVPDEKIRQAIDDLGLGKWRQSLPEGLDTLLEAGGGGLSAGEAQLLAFTRIFLKNPGLVVLDEASSRLDPATEALVEQAVRRLVQDRTAIIIAHRLGTVQQADEIMILEAGRILEHGAREQLALDPRSHFYQLLQTGMEEVLV